MSPGGLYFQSKLFPILHGEKEKYPISVHSSTWWVKSSSGRAILIRKMPTWNEINTLFTNVHNSILGGGGGFQTPWGENIH